ncbi:sensor histidine kinase N-terminal domain-containing protein [Diaphorobacter caeni]|uniref:sensor histidine kinase N-terminal domain-containing protein n=1 Tax=Diaphorobacter caeni TaxID=2784387 RepID=UPI001E5D663F|nr:sensor histidine kinase N-terminal domain-containing protein [Diaphorobacter caeni]
MTGRPYSLRRHLVGGIIATTCLMWGSVATWQFASMQREMRTMLDERLMASAKMVAAVVEQIRPGPHGSGALSRAEPTLQSLIARDGVECEVSLVRSEVDVIPIARTGNAPDLSAQTESGFGHAIKGGKPWRTYVLEHQGIRVVTADRMDVREHLVQSMLRTLVLPFVLTLAGIALMSWWI